MAGFTFAYTLGGGAPLIKKFVVADGEIFTKGEMVNLETGELDSGVAADVTLVGAVTEDCDNTADGLLCECIYSPDAVYAVADANVRVAGALLDLASGGLGLTTDSSHTFVVVEDSSATEDTLVTFNSSHFLNT